MNLINLLLFIVVLLNSSIPVLAAPTRSRDAKSHKKDASLNKVDTTPNLEDTDVFTVTSEANLYQNSLYENFDIDFSSTNGWDVQLSSYNVPVYQDPNLDLPYQADTFINVSKTFKLNNSLNLIFGSQNGTYLAAKPTVTQWQNLDYSQVLWQVNSLISLRGGLYWANSIMSGTTDVLGYIPGFTVNLIEDKLTLQADYYSGQSNLSGAIVNLQYQASRYFQSYIGVGVPEQNSGNEFYGIVGFTLSSRGLF
ncbi:MAG: hypothetical protein NTX38_13375 [Methylobacter sp.]|nr:hypothetical protein [Methylobacter sp.]